jgi:hypothetical protein
VCNRKNPRNQDEPCWLDGVSVATDETAREVGGGGASRSLRERSEQKRPITAPRRRYSYFGVGTAGESCCRRNCRKERRFRCGATARKAQREATALNEPRASRPPRRVNVVLGSRARSLGPDAPFARLARDVCQFN